MGGFVGNEQRIGNRRVAVSVSVGLIWQISLNAADNFDSVTIDSWELAPTHCLQIGDRQ